MKKTIFRAINLAALAAVICIGCGGDDGSQEKNLNISDILDAITGRGTPTVTRTLTVNVLPGDGGSVSRSPNKTSYSDGEQVNVTAAPLDGYKFNGWSGTLNDTAAALTVTMNSDLTLTANFIPIGAETRRLTVNSEPSAGGNVSREPNRTVYNVGERVTVTAAALDCYTFVGWSGDANGAEPSVTVSMNSDLTITANFRQNTYSLSVGASPAAGGTVSRDPQKAVYTCGDQVTVTAKPANGYTFKGWADDTAPENETVTVTIDGNKTLTAIFEQQLFTLATNVLPSSGYGSILRDPNKEKYTYGEQVTVTAAEAPKNGDYYYAFTGWTGASESNSAGVTVTMDGNKTLTANFKQDIVPCYTLSTVTKISRSPDKTCYKEGETVTVTAPTPDEYTFTGWSGDATVTTNPVTVTMNKNMMLTANYIQNNYKLTVETYPDNSGSVSRNPDNPAYTHNQTVALTPAPANGFRFTGWSGDMSGTANPATITMNSDKTVRANFEPRPYRLEIVKNINGGDVTVSPNKDAYDYNERVTVTAEAASCYTFTGWSGAATGTTNQVTITMNDNKTLTANFQPSQYTLTTNISPAGGGTVSRSPNNTNYNCGATVTVTAVANLGYEFIEWSGETSGTANPISIIMDDNKTLTANFRLKQYTLATNVSPSNGGTVSRDLNQSSYAHGTNITVTATAASCYTFIGWSGDVTSAANPLPITITKDMTLTANFQLKQYSLSASVSPSGGGTVQPYPSQTSYACGTNVTITATAASCYTFIGWSGAATGTTNPVTITVDGNKELIANFQQKSYTLQINTNGGTVSRSPNKDTYLCGEEVTVTAILTSGNTFYGWSGASSSTNTSIKITMDGNKELTANFQKDKYTLTTNISPSLSSGSISRSPNPDQIYYDYGNQVTVTATAASCYTFTGWSGASTSTSPSITITMDDYKTLTANFQQYQYTVSTSVSPSSSYGSVSRSPNQTNYACGTSVTLTATPTNSDYMFDSWIGAPSNVSASSASITFVVNSNMTLTANFKVKKSIPIDRNNNSAYTFNSGFPATVEVYAFGAGGGGAGGSNNSDNGVKMITGGAGGGGAAVKAKFTIQTATTFNITVGSGGSGGAGKSSGCAACAGWNYGDNGVSGGLSMITGGGVTITAGGGGAGQGGSSSSGGSGGSGGTSTVSGTTDIEKNNGYNGDKGGYNQSGNNGGAGGSFNVSGYGTTISAGKGGSGGYGHPTQTSQNQNVTSPGKPGGNGRVIIIFTWWE